MSSPTQRTLKFLRGNGYLCAVTERWNPHAGIRQDLFGFIDIVALHPETKTIYGIQATSASNMSSRQKKIAALPAARTWLACGGEIMVVGWRKKREGGRDKWVSRCVLAREALSEDR